MDLGKPCEEIEPLMVPLADAGTQPGAVVVVHGNTAVADFTVEDARGSYNIAGGTPLAGNLFLDINIATFITPAALS